MPISTSAHFTPCQINFKIGVINKIISLPTWADEESSWPNPRLWPIAWARLLARIWGSNGFTSTLIPTDLSVQIRPTLAVVVSPLEKEFLPLKLKSSYIIYIFILSLYLILFILGRCGMIYEYIWPFWSNTTEIELLDTKLDPYIWFTALLSEIFYKNTSYTHVNICVVSFSILWSFLWA